LSIFRSAITHENKNEAADKHVKGMITLKLFNLLVSEMGPAFLERGCWVTTGLLCNFMESKKEVLPAGLKSIVMSGQEIELSGLENLKKNDKKELIHITVQVEK